MNLLCRGGRLGLVTVVGIVSGLLHSDTLHAGITSKVLQEAFEFTTRKFSKEVAEEGVERLAAKMSGLASRYSDDVVAQAFKRVGPRASKLVSEAGEFGDELIGLLAKHGDMAIPLATRKVSLGLAKKFGQEAGEACVKHGTIAEPIIDQFGAAGAKALTQVSERSGRQMAMMASDGALKPELIDVILRYGDKACEFIWKNKGVISAGAALSAFVSSPEEFFNGTAELTKTIVPPMAESVVAPLAQSVMTPIATSAAESFPWTLTWVILLTAVSFSAWRWWPRAGRQQAGSTQK